MRLEQIEGMAREVRRALDREALKRSPFTDVAAREARINADRLLDWLDELLWLAKNPL